MHASPLVIAAVGRALDIAAVVAMVAGGGAAVIAAIVELCRVDATTAYRGFRHNLGRAILVGLELLVAADIARTIGESPTFEGLGMLAAIVAIRTVLSFTLAVELDGRWPWQSPK